MSEESERNPSRHDPLPSVDDIAEMAENETKENAILIAQTEISCLDDLSIRRHTEGNLRHGTRNR
jgi:hypothetical protein